MPDFPRDAACVAGIGHSAYGKRGEFADVAVASAYAAIATGLADYVVVVRSIVQTSRLGQSVAAGVGPGAPIPLSASYTAPFGMALPAAIYAMKARRHMSLYGTTTEHLAEVAINA